MSFGRARSRQAATARRRRQSLPAALVILRQPLNGDRTRRSFDRWRRFERRRSSPSAAHRRELGMTSLIIAQAAATTSAGKLLRRKHVESHGLRASKYGARLFHTPKSSSACGTTSVKQFSEWQPFRLMKNSKSSKNNNSPAAQAAAQAAAKAKRLVGPAAKGFEARRLLHRNAKSVRRSTPF